MIYKPTASNKLNREIKAVNSGKRQRGPLSPHLFNTVLAALARAIRQLKEFKGMQIGKEEVKVSLSADDMIIYISDRKNSTRKLLQLINKVIGYKINTHTKKIISLPIYK